MADDSDKDDDWRVHHKAAMKHLKNAGDALDKANDSMDNIESRLSGITGQRLPQPRPRAAGPDAAGNDKSSNAQSRDWYEKDE